MTKENNRRFKILGREFELKPNNDSKSAYDSDGNPTPSFSISWFPMDDPEKGRSFFQLKELVVGGLINDETQFHPGFGYDRACYISSFTSSRHPSDKRRFANFDDAARVLKGLSEKYPDYVDLHTQEQQRKTAEDEARREARRAEIRAKRMASKSPEEQARIEQSRELRRQQAEAVAERRAARTARRNEKATAIAANRAAREQQKAASRAAREQQKAAKETEKPLIEVYRPPSTADQITTQLVASNIITNEQQEAAHDAVVRGLEMPVHGNRTVRVKCTNIMLALLEANVVTEQTQVNAQKLLQNYFGIERFETGSSLSESRRITLVGNVSNYLLAAKVIRPGLEQDLRAAVSDGVEEAGLLKTGPLPSVFSKLLNRGIFEPGQAGAVNAIRSAFSL